MTFTLGLTPLSMDVQLSADADFDTTIVNTDGDWAVGEALELRFGDGTIWAATMAGDEAAFHADKAAVNTLIAVEPAYAALFCIDGTAEAQWANGTVTING